MKRPSGAFIAILLVAAYGVLQGCGILLEYRTYAAGTPCTARIVEITIHHNDEYTHYDALLEYVADGAVYTTIQDRIDKNRYVGEERLIRYDPERPHVVHREPNFGGLAIACFVLVWFAGDAISKKIGSPRPHH